MAVDYIQLLESGLAVRFMYFDTDGNVYKHSGSGSPLFEAFNNSNWSDYQVTATEAGSSKRYQVTTPATVALRAYSFCALQRVDGTPANDLPLGISGDAMDIRYVASYPAVLGTSGVVVNAVSAGEVVTATSVGGTMRHLSMFQNSKAVFAWVIVDGAGAPVNLTGDSIKMVVHVKDADAQKFVVDGADVVLSASNPGAPAILDKVSITVQKSKVALLYGTFQYKVRNLTDEAVYGSGDFTVLRAPTPL